MKKLMFALLTALIVGGTASARDTLFESPNASVLANFYQSDPAAGGALLESEYINNSPFARSFSDSRGHEFVTLAYEGETFTFATFPGGFHKDNIYLNLEGVEKGGAAYTQARENAMSLGDLMDELAGDPNALQNLSN